MTSSVLQRLLHGARVRRGLDAVALCMPWAIAAVMLAWHWRGGGVAIAVLLVAMLLLVAWTIFRTRAIDSRWLSRRLDASRPDMEDSAELLFASDDALSGLQRLQRARLRERLEAAPRDLRPAWSMRGIAISIAVALVAVAGVLLWPASPAQFDEVIARVTGTTVAPTHTRLIEPRLRVTPPAYTRQAAREEPSLNAKAPHGTRLQWTLRFAPQPQSVALAFHDGRRVTLRREGDEWRGDHVLTKSALYRIVLDGAVPPLQTDQPHRLDAIADRPPQVRVLEPDRSLSLITPGQRSWPVAFEATDDYGVAAAARLRITLAQGSGENITFREQTITLRGSGTATGKRFAHRLDLASLGFAVGDDLIVQLGVDDNRTPAPQSARSASLILRWPSDLGTETSGLEGMVKKTLPAYFRSQRQIIIDAEALLKDKRKLAAERFLKRSDEIGVDQRILRLRYGQFLGEEAEGAPKPPPVQDAVAVVTESHSEDEAHHDEHDHAEPAAAETHDGHDHGGDADAAPTTFGQESAVLEEYGHTHDHAEAATLLDPETRTILKAALDAMWQSELHLRQGHPDQALPHAYRALARIKEVQQASRIYLARVGPELPPIDESRRLSGDRAGIARRGDPLVPATVTDTTLATLWHALDDATPRSGVERDAINFASLERWLRDNESRIADPLSFVAAVDALRAEPDCERCRRELRAQLWPLLPRPPAAVPRRDDGDASGRRYLDALREASR